MLEKDTKRLKVAYPGPMRPEDPGLLRLAGPLGLDLRKPVQLGDEIVADLDSRVYGIGWWQEYQDIDTKTRIFLSDYLVACARAVPGNLVEARVEHLELNHAEDDYRKWMERGVKPDGKFAFKPPRGPYEELSYLRVETHLAGMLRAWGSALDCVGGCIIGVAGLPADLVRADLKTARDSLRAPAQGSLVLRQLQADLERAEAQAGPPGWREWLLGMRNTVVHRGRRTVTWSSVVDATGLTGFTLRLPVSPEMTDVKGAVSADGYIAASFAAPAAEMLDQLGSTVGTYISDACGILGDLWRKRRADPALLAQSPRQRSPPRAAAPEPVFHGFPNLTQTPDPTTVDVGTEAAARLNAAALTARSEADIKPDPKVWA
jgi:hypothetical protein